MASRSGKSAALVALSALFVAGRGWAQTDKPRFVILLDNSTSMTQDLVGVETHGDGSEAHPGCNIDKSTAVWPYDNSKLYQAKAAVIDTISAFGAAEFAFATYNQTLLGGSCSGDSNCTATVGATCVSVPGVGTTQKYCAYHGSGSYACLSGSSCVTCANASLSDDLVFNWGAFACPCSFSAGCIGGQILVSFPSAGTSNLLDIYHWIDGKEDLPPFSAISNREIRAVTLTPLASALDSVRAWLTDASKTSIGAGAGLLSSNATARDPRASCRPYNIILITDGEDTCSPQPTDPVSAAKTAFGKGIGVYVVGFGTGFSTALNDMAMAGSGQTRSAYFASNRADLTANLGDILINAIPKPRCNCDATCYDEAAAFPLKGQPCSVGIGRCKRQGVYACNTTGDGVMCATAASCGATALVAGAPAPEQCGALAGCQAPSAADCADENCDGNIDEGLSCTCTSKPEVCNGLDDNCNGIVDDIAQVSCGLDLGACKPGLTACASDGAGGQKVVCQGEVGPTAEICDGIDNDCDGIIDQFARSCYPAGAAGCTYDATSKTWACVGACATGMQICSAGAWQPCVGAVTPVSEIACDGLDNNCDGRVDENNPLATDACYPPATVGCTYDAASKGWTCVGACAFGHLACAANKMGLTCAGSHVPVAESCNGKDDDCDGQIDEDFPTLGQPCNQQSCQGAGQLVCNAAGNDVECTVKSAGPTPEICDGIDNNCNGFIDESPGPGEPPMTGTGVVCGSDVGACKTGVSTCTNGKIVCSAVGPTPEICDGLDNDCNGSIDEGLVVPAGSCNPSGMAPGQPMVGECRPGTFVCQGSAGWGCQGGMGPAPEICDGKDNDCDGVPDNNASCAAGYVCVSGQCIPTCTTGGEQYPCPADRFCKDGACIVKACALSPCPAGTICQDDGTCADPCSKIPPCLTGATCKNGVCVDCYSTGCSAGKLCIKRECAVDPCAGKTCAAGQFCNAGACVPSCAEVTCGQAQVCSHGICMKPACSQTCDNSSFCDVLTGACRPSPCTAVGCPAGMVCLNTTGLCANDPCEQVRCGNGQVCVVADDGSSDCAISIAPGVAVQTQSAGSGVFGCSCSLASTRAQDHHGWLDAFVLLIAAGIWRGRRRRD
ncbi:MAG TPA: MopE-related protein [Polyangia bacterium]